MNKYPYLIMTAAVIMGSSSCIDQRYDISNGIDLTIGVGGDQLALPVGKTDTIFVKNLLEFDDYGILNTDSQGNYFLKIESEEPITEEFLVNPITIDEPDPVTLNIEIGLPFEGEIPEDLPEQTVDIDIPYMEPEILEFEPIEIPEMISELISAKCNGKLVLTARLNDGIVSMATIKSLNITIPKWASIEGEDNVINFTDINVTNGQPLTFEYAIDGIDFDQANFDPGTGFNPDTHILTLGGSISVNGIVSVSSKDISGDASEGFVLTLEARIVPDGTNTIGITEATAVINYESEKFEESIGIDMPQELTKANATLDLQDSRLLIDIDNATPISGIAQAGIRTLDRDNIQLASSDVSLKIDKEAKNSYIISEDGQKQNGYETVALAGFDDLFNRIPANIEVSAIFSCKDYQTTVTLGENMAISFDYAFTAPLKFGEDFHLEYSHTIDGLNVLPEGFSLEYACINAVFKSRIPMGVNLNAIAIDTQGNAIDGIEILFNGSTGGLEIPVQPTGEENEFPVEIKVTQLRDGALAEFYGVIINVAADASNGQNINERDYILFEDIKAMVGGIQGNLNEIDTNE